jgi:hypothetical protein
VPLAAPPKNRPNKLFYAVAVISTPWRHIHKLFSWLSDISDAAIESPLVCNSVGRNSMAVSSGAAVSRCAWLIPVEVVALASAASAAGSFVGSV